MRQQVLKGRKKKEDLLQRLMSTNNMKEMSLEERENLDEIFIDDC